MDDFLDDYDGLEWKDWMIIGPLFEDIDAGDPRPYDPNFASIDNTLKLAAVRQETEGVNTTLFSIVDRWGNVVSCTSTIEGTWGSGITVPNYGFLLNNELTDLNSAPTAKGELEDDDYYSGANDVSSVGFASLELGLLRKSPRFRVTL